MVRSTPLESSKTRFDPRYAHIPADADMIFEPESANHVAM